MGYVWMCRKLLVACVALPFFAGSACAMSMAANPAVRCSVQRADLLPPQVGGAAAVCSAVQEATAGGTRPLSVVVTVRSANELVATVTNSAGRTLPELRFAKSDRPLSHASVKRFAQAIAAAARR